MASHAAGKLNIDKALLDQGRAVMPILASLPSSFYLTLNAHLERLKAEEGFTEDELYYRTGINQRSISGYRNKETNISIENVYALCVGMQLHPLLSDDLVRKAKGHYPYNEEGFLAAHILHNHYMESLKDINAMLIEAGYKPWGVPDKILE